jgi:predicted transcriptional regulator
MDLGREHELFGGRVRTSVLTAIRLLGETYASELASVLDVRLFAVQRVLRSLEHEAVIVSRSIGRTRAVSLNPRYFAHRELAQLLWRMGREDTDLQVALASRRRRPRRTGKSGL